MNLRDSNEATAEFPNVGKKSEERKHRITFKERH